MTDDNVKKTTNIGDYFLIKENYFENYFLSHVTTGVFCKIRTHFLECKQVKLTSITTGPLMQLGVLSSTFRSVPHKKHSLLYMRSSSYLCV